MKIENDELREALFLGGCIPVRMLTILGAAVWSAWLAIPLIIFYVSASIGSMISAATNRERGFFGQKKWWFSSVHSLNFFLFTIFTIAQFSLSWFFLLIDVIFGIVCYYTIRKEYELDIQDPVVNFGTGDLTEEERNENVMEEIERSMKNPFSILLSNGLNNKREDRANDVSVI